MISKILKGGKPSHELSADIQKVSVNLSQLISLKSVKQKRREGTQKFCHPKKQWRVDAKNSGRRKQCRLPVSYKDIQPTVSRKPRLPVSSDIDPDSFFLDGSASAHPNDWLLKLATAPEDIKYQMSFPAYFSRTSLTISETSSHFQPLFTEPKIGLATGHHTADMAKAITWNVNPGHPVVITVDRPVYGLGKQLQWIFPEEFRDFVWMLGPLHIEQNFIKAIGDWLEGSEWTKIYEYSSNNSPGKGNSFLSCEGVAGIKRSQYAHQVSLAALVILGNEAFQAQ